MRVFVSTLCVTDLGFCQVVLSDLILLELQLDADLVASVGLDELGELEHLHGLGVLEDAVAGEVNECVAWRRF